MRRELFILVSASAISLGAVATACSSSSTTNTVGTDSGVNTHPATDDSGTGGSDSGSGDTDSGTDTDAGVAGDAGFKGCATYTDNTGKAEVDLTWDFSIAMQGDRCSKIKVGSAVKWTGNFSTHPLQATTDGDQPNPVGGAPDGGAITVTFAKAGLFGYECQNHPNQMFGAMFVVP